MAKKPIKGMIKLQIPAGQATPAPPVGPALGQQGVNIVQFTQAFNEATRDRQGLILPVVITVYEDRTFDFILKSPPASVLIKKAANLAKAANNPGSETVAEVTRAQLEDIAKTKMADLNAADMDGAVKIIAGTARSMGIAVKDM